MKTIMLAFFILLGSLPLAETTYNDVIVAPPADTYTGNSLITYVMYSQVSATFNEARSVCQENGGDLAKIDSIELMDQIDRMVKETYNYADFFSKEYWVGIIRLNVDKYYWVADCSSVTNQKYYHQTFTDGKYCYRHRKDTHLPESVPCDTNQSFLCQKYSTADCPYISRLESFAQTLSSSSSTCEGQCTSISDCWGTVQVLPDSVCVLLVAKNMGSQRVNVTSKRCVEVFRNTSTPSYETNNDKVPGHSCSALSASNGASPAASQSMSIVPSSSKSCPTVTITPSPVYVTDIVSVTVNVTVTSVALSTVHDIAVKSYATTVTVSTNLVCPTQTVTITPTPLYVTDVVTVTAVEQTIHTSCVDSMTVLSPMSSIAMDVAESSAEEFVKNLTVDPKSTSSHRRSLISADDPRSSSLFIASASLLVVVVPFGILLLADCYRLVHDFRFEPIPKKNS